MRNCFPLLYLIIMGWALSARPYVQVKSATVFMIYRHLQSIAVHCKIAQILAPKKVL